MNDDKQKSVSLSVLNARVDYARRDQRWLGAFLVFIVVSIVCIIIALLRNLNQLPN